MSLRVYRIWIRSSILKSCKNEIIIIISFTRIIKINFSLIFEQLVKCKSDYSFRNTDIVGFLSINGVLQEINS